MYTLKNIGQNFFTLFPFQMGQDLVDEGKVRILTYTL